MAVEPTTREPERAEERQQASSAAQAARADLGLSELVATMERVDWRRVPTISTAEAAALTQRFVEARDAVRAGGES